MSRRWLVGMPLSIALHAALLVAALALVRVERTPTGLIIDLNAIIVGRDDGSSKSDGAPAPPPALDRAPTTNRAVAAARPITPAASHRDASPRESAPVPASAPPSDPPAIRHDEPPAAIIRDNAPSSSASSIAPASTEAGSTSDAPSGRTEVGTGPTGRGESPIGASGRGGTGSERVASLGLPDGSGAGSDYAMYYASLRQRIQEALRYPVSAYKRGVSGTVHLEIAVHADGAIGAVSVIGSSTHRVLDRAAVEAAKSVPRLPFPSHLRPRPLLVRLPVIFELHP